MNGQLLPLTSLQMKKLNLKEFYLLTQYKPEGEKDGS